MPSTAVMVLSTSALNAFAWAILDLASSKSLLALAPIYQPALRHYKLQMLPKPHWLHRQSHQDLSLR